MVRSFDQPSPFAPFLTGRASESFGIVPPTGLVSATLGIAPPQVKRRAYFSFHYDDVMRANVVRKAWTVVRPDDRLGRTFYDSSLWEARQLEGVEALKRLMREGVTYTSAVCVLIGTNTWWRRWVRYEIARAVIDGRGLLAVHINGIRHHQERVPHICGPNPLAFMGVAKVQQSNAFAVPSYCLAELTQEGWVRYQDYTKPVPLPRYLPDPNPGYVMSLATGTAERDYIDHHGSTNIGAWIDAAAQAAGR